ncbi:MAG: 5'/3'-nucleotidase SurE [Planctomycetota bacterium]
MRILLTNDDGIDAPGILALREAIDPLGDVHVVAPSRVQSATSHAVTFHRPVAVERRDAGFAVHGRPADCVKLGLHTLFDQPFDLVVSGMNSGANVGVNVLYSGTVGAAREATFSGVPAIAVSLHIGDWRHDHWARAAGHARRAIEAVLAEPMGKRDLVNLNVPVLDGGAEPRGLRVAPLSMTKMVIEYERGEDDEGRETYRVSNPMTFSEKEAGTDVGLLFERYVTVTPLRFDPTSGDLSAMAERMNRGVESGTNHIPGVENRRGVADAAV